MCYNPKKKRSNSIKKNDTSRREFLRTIGQVGAASVLAGKALAEVDVAKPSRKKRSGPNLVYVFADQWRAQDVGYAGNNDVITPNLDKLARQSANLTNAVSCCPVCTPYRASLITGRYPLTTGLFLNDVRLSNDAVSIAQAYNKAGYETGLIGKWHLDGRERSAYIPRERRQGFKFWEVLDCTHRYNNSYYYADKNVRLKWNGYDAIDQTRHAQKYIKDNADNPFALFLSWGPPHNPYMTAPQKYKNLYKNKELKLRPNVPDNQKANARKDLVGYYAHITALDDCIGRLLKTIKDTGLEENTIFVFTSDHGDMLGSQGWSGPQKIVPWDESVLVPFLLRYPGKLGRNGRKIETPIGTPDIMPTLLGLSNIEIPDTVEGSDFSDIIKGQKGPTENVALLNFPWAWSRYKLKGGKEYRGIRTKQYTYVRNIDGPWLMYDNKKDPYQLDNLCNKPEHTELQKKLEAVLSQKLKETNDEFLPGAEYIKKWGYKVRSRDGAIPYV